MNTNNVFRRFTPAETSFKIETPPVLIRTEGDLDRGTTSGSPHPHGMRPHQVNQPGSAVSGAPGEAYCHKRVRFAAQGCIHGAPSPLFTNQRFSLQGVLPLLLPIIAFPFSYYKRIFPFCQPKYSFPVNQRDHCDISRQMRSILLHPQALRQ